MAWKKFGEALHADASHGAGSDRLDRLAMPREFRNAARHRAL
jgi:hypothetical protein